MNYYLLQNERDIMYIPPIIETGLQPQSLFSFHHKNYWGTNIGLFLPLLAGVPVVVSMGAGPPVHPDLYSLALTYSQSGYSTSIF